MVKKLFAWLRRLFCNHSWSWNHGGGWSKRRCVRCGDVEWFA